jgi:hypothetical protein
MMDPQVGHPTCDLSLQRRIMDARREAVAHELARRRRRRVGLLARLFHRHALNDPVLDAQDLVAHGEDVWKSLRF